MYRVPWYWQHSYMFAVQSGVRYMVLVAVEDVQSGVVLPVV